MPNLNDIMEMMDALETKAIITIPTFCVAVRNRHSSCRKCADVCLADAFTIEKNELNIDAGACVACGACVAVCPTGATAKDEETGIVTQDTETCIGCQSCVEACPYQAVGAGVRTYLEAEPEFLVGFPVGNSEAPTHVKNTVEKCNLCYQRISEGDLPACVEGCPTLAMTFGDLNDPESDISKLIAERECEQLLVDAGTGPCMYYLK